MCKNFRDLPIVELWLQSMVYRPMAQLLAVKAIIKHWREKDEGKTIRIEKEIYSVLEWLPVKGIPVHDNL